MANFAYMSYIYADSTKADTKSVQFEKSGASRTQGSAEDAVPISLDSDPRSEYLEIAQTAERSLFIVGFTVIASAILQARSTPGLTAYHALIVLNISQINNWAGFLLLFMRGWLRLRFKREGESSLRVLIFPASWTSSLLCAAHSLAMSGLGLFLWIDSAPFYGYGGEYLEQPCRPLVYFWAFRTADMSDNLSRMFSIMFYATTLIPYVGLWFQLFVFALGLAYATLIAMAVLTFAQLLLERLASICRVSLTGLRRLFTCHRPFILEEAAAERTVSSSGSKMGGTSFLLTTLLVTTCIPIVYNYGVHGTHHPRKSRQHRTTGRG